MTVNVRRLGLAVALLLFASTARADGYDAAMAHASVAKEAALDSGKPGDWEEALQRFLVADALRTTRESKYEIALAARALKEDDLAFEAYEASIALGLEGSAREKADAFLAEQGAKVARLGVVGPKGATLTIGSRRRGVLPLDKPVVVFAGLVKLRVGDLEASVTVSPGENRTVDVTPKPPPPPPPPIKPPPPLPPPERPSRTLDWTLAIGGGTLAVAGFLTYAIAARTVAARRESLEAVCARRREDDPDLCAEASDPIYREWAQQDSDLIYTFKPLRTVGLVTAAVGIIAAGVGVFRLTRVTPMAAVSSSGGTFGLRVSF